VTATYNETGLVYNETDTTYDGDAYGPLPFPIVGVYIAWNDGPYVANPAWTEITNYVRAISTRRGRSDDFEQFDTGTAQLVLDNRDRRFDPFYTSGPYYLKLTPRRQIRIVGQANGVNYDIFRGFVAGWPVAWTDAGYDSTVTIQAFDALGLMAGEVVPTDWVYQYTTSLNPVHYWRADEAQPVSVIKDQIGGWDVRPFGTQPIKAYEGPVLANGLLASSIFTADWSYAVAAPAQTETITFASWVKLSTYQNEWSPGFFYTSTIFFLDGSMQLQVKRGDTTATLGRHTIIGTAVVGSTAYSRTATYSPPTGSIDDPFHVALVLIYAGAAAPTLKIYINGELQTFTTTTGSGPAFVGNTNAFQCQYGAFQEAASWRRELSATEIRNLYEFGSGRIQETTTARMNRLIGSTDWPTALTAFTSTPAASVSEINTGTGVIPEMQLVADSEGGSLYVSKAGVLTMTNRTDVFNAPRSSTPQATITDSGAGLGYGTELQIDYDADALSNDVTVTFSGNGEVNAYSDAVIEAYGAAATTIETQLADPTSASQLATRQLGVQGSLVPRISPLDLSVNTSQSDWQTILGLELLDRVTFKRTPTVGNQFSREALVNAIEHTIEPGSWSTSVQLSMRYTSPLVLDDDVLGTLDFNYLG
jgi:hypothetical protein